MDFSKTESELKECGFIFHQKNKLLREKKSESMHKGEIRLHEMLRLEVQWVEGVIFDDDYEDKELLLITTAVHGNPTTHFRVDIHDCRHSFLAFFKQMAIFTIHGWTDRGIMHRGMYILYHIIWLSRLHVHLWFKIAKFWQGSESQFRPDSTLLFWFREETKWRTCCSP